MAVGANFVAGEVDLILRRLGLALCYENIHRYINKYRAGSARGGYMKSFTDSPGQFIDVLNYYIMFCDRPCYARGIGFLESVVADKVCAYLAGDGDHWD